MKKILIILCLATLACNRKNDNPKPAPTEIRGDTVVAPRAHNAKNSLEYLGMYKGRLPCENCGEVSLELSEDFSYVLTKNASQRKGIEQKGTFKWNQDNVSIALSAPSAMQFLVEEKLLIPLDQTGARQNKYGLKKLTDAQAAKTDDLASAKPVDITSVHWKLSELYQKPVSKANGKSDLYIEFKRDQSFGMYAGCNNIGGHFEIKGTKIKFLRVIGTQMACEDMSVEDQFSRALHEADNFVANEKVLQLRRGGVTLAKFYATQLKK